MAKFRSQQKNVFVRDDFNSAMLEENVDAIYNVSVKRHVLDGNGKKHYLTLNLQLGQESFSELLLKKIEPKRVRWMEWIPPSAEEREEAQASGKQAYGDTIPYTGAL